MCLQTTDFVEPVGASSVANPVLALLDGDSGLSKQTVNEDKQSPDCELFVDEDAISVTKNDKPNKSNDLFDEAGEDLDSKDDFTELILNPICLLLFLTTFHYILIKTFHHRRIRVELLIHLKLLLRRS
jgi:hypothetical protein